MRIIDRNTYYAYFRSMLIVFGLGNNSDKYLNTKHNIGRILLEKWIGHLDHTGFKTKNKFFASRTDSFASPLYFVLLTGFMNVSGEALSDFSHFYKLDKKDTTLIILQDDSDQMEGSWKLVQGGRSAGHKGIDSIHQHILGISVDTTNIWRLKIGIRPNLNKEKSISFVLNRCSKTDDEVVDKLTELCIKNCSSMLAGDWPKVQNIFNTKVQ